MAHGHSHSLYDRLVERLNKFPQGAPPSDALYAILKVLFSEREAGLVAQLPLRPFTVATAARIWKVDEAAARKTLDELASRAMLLDLEQHGEQVYCLPPPMAGFFEFSLMRVRGDLDQHLLSELFHQYLNVEEDFVKALFVGETPLGRIFAQERVLDGQGRATSGSYSAVMDEPRLEVLDYERASHLIRTATHRGVSLCYCRHKMEHLGKACSAPREICLTLNASAASLTKHGHARAVDVPEALDLLAQAQDADLVQFGENAREGVNFICNCCGCCCEALLSIKRFALARTIHSNFEARISAACTGCGRCARVCPVQAISRGGEQAAFEVPGAGSDAKTFAVQADRCIGCGVCVRGCHSRAITLLPRPERDITPLNTAHRVVLMAAERGTLKELIEDNNALADHRLMAAVLGSLTSAPGPLRDMALRQLKSRYMERLMQNQ